MKIFNRYILRFLILLTIGLIYLNHRNNKCILNQNCQPYFITEKFSSNKIYPTLNIINYKIIDNHSKIEIKIDKKFDEKNKFILGNINENVKFIYDGIIKKNDELYSSQDIIDNNYVMIKKITITNTTNLDTKTYAKIKVDPIDKSKLIKFYSCFCNERIELKAYETKDLYIYFKLKNIVGEATIEMQFDHK